jgi:hypothetical protein
MEDFVSVAPTTSVAPAAPERPDLAGIAIGSDPNPERVPPFVDYQASRRVYGAKAGYGSFQDAFLAATHATEGDRNPAAAIFNIDGHYFAQGVDRLTTTPLWHGGEDKVKLEKFRFETDPELVTNLERSNERVLALVDGAASLTFGKPSA